MQKRGCKKRHYFVIFTYGVFTGGMDFTGDEMDICTGDVICGKYRVLKLLGQGAFGRVYLTEHVNLQVYRALKCIERCQDSYSSAIHEADILKNLRHPAIPIIYDIEETEDCVCIIEEYAQGVPLTSFISNKKSISTRKAVEIALSICDVVEYLHDNRVVHQDIKPENIIINGDRIKLLDYGNAGTADKDNSNLTGTRGYAAPEQYEPGTVSVSSDIYALGVVILMLVTGSRDVNAADAVRPQQLGCIIKDCLAHSRKQRIGSVEELMNRLQLVNRRRSVQHISRRIAFAGLESHCGTTHCAFMTAYAYTNCGMKTVLTENNTNADFTRIIRTSEHIIFSKGIFRIKGLDIMPNYHNCVLMDLSKYQVTVADYGVLSEENISSILECDIICLVMDGAVYRMDDNLHNPYFISILQQLTSNSKDIRDRLRLLINYTDAAQYTRMVRRYDIPAPVRVPYIKDLHTIHVKGLNRH